MYNLQGSSLLGDIQRMINQMQQNERNNANTLRSLASQLQNLAATETQAIAMLQQLQVLTNQLAMEQARNVPFAYPSPDTIRSSVSPNQATSSIQPATGATAHWPGI